MVESQDEYRFSRGVRGALLFAAIVMLVLVVTLPLGIYFLIRRSRARLRFDEGGFTVTGLGLAQRWSYGELDRIGVLSIELAGGGPLVALNGGSVAVNLCALTRRGKKLKFMLSRFEAHEQILERIVSAAGLPLENVSMGAMGPSWPERQGAG